MILIISTMGLAFCATLLSIRGDTWREGAQGFRKITHTGWAALAVALVTFVIGVASTLEAHRAAMSNKYLTYVEFISPLIRLEREVVLGATSPDSAAELDTKALCNEIHDSFMYWNSRESGELMTMIGSLALCEIEDDTGSALGFIAYLTWVNDEICRIMESAGREDLCQGRLY